MSRRVQRIRRRRAGDSVATHDRARGLAATRLDQPLTPTEATWLDEHLSWCGACGAVAASYGSDRLALRSMRDRAPEPPRDLWARTSAAIEREAARSGRTHRRAATRRPRPALGVLSGIAVIAVVIGASVMSGGWLNTPTTISPEATSPAVALASPSARPGPTPIVVGAGSVGWVGTSADGRLAYNLAPVKEVCPVERQPDCAEVDGKPRHVEMRIRPKSISQSPVRNEAVVVGTDGSGSDAVYVIALPTSEPTSTPSPTATPEPPATPVPPTTEPSATPEPSTDVSAPPATESAEPPATPSPEPAATATPEPPPSETATPAPTLAAALAIVSDVKVVGQSASYSPSGDWFAFTARPSDGTSGPDIYVWRVGDELARPLTDDHASVFGSWVGSRLIGSRPEVVDGSGAVAPTSFILDPSTGAETAIEAPVWRPVVDPDGHWAVTWDGTVRVDPDTHTAVPDRGSLVLAGYSPATGVKIDGASPVVVEGVASDFDVRWDETGTWLAVWIADTSDPSIGRLSLVHVDPVSGDIERPDGAPQDRTSMPGFSIANGRLAWATPPGQGGEGSRVQIVAWTDEAVGAVESGPSTDVVVIH